jgi:hypothetical protein
VKLARSSVNELWVFHDGIDSLPGAVLQSPEKTGFAPSVAGNATGLVNCQEQHIAVAVKADLAHRLGMA